MTQFEVLMVAEGAALVVAMFAQVWFQALSCRQQQAFIDRSGKAD